MSKEEKLSKHLSYLLRHDEKTVNPNKDANGWVNTNEIISKLQKVDKTFDIGFLEQIVKNDIKIRYSFNGDKSKIRANNGHSVPGINPELSETVPPEILYHGTSIKTWQEFISKEGIESMSRNMVHLSHDCDTAFKVGKRHGTPKILLIEAKKMYNDGYKFYMTTNNVWLTNYVPTNYIKE